MYIDLLSIQLKGNLRTIHIHTYPHGGDVDLKGAYHHKDDESSQCDVGQLAVCVPWHTGDGLKKESQNGDA